jgi:hypothetical protein
MTMDRGCQTRKYAGSFRGQEEDDMKWNVRRSTSGDKPVVIVEAESIQSGNVGVLFLDRHNNVVGWIATEPGLAVTQANVERSRVKIPVRDV